MAQSFELSIQRIPDWISRIKEEVIDANPINRELQWVRKQLEDRIDLLAEQQDEYFTCSAVRFLRRYAPLPAVSTTLLLGMLLGTRLLRGELARAGAVMRGFANA